MKNHNFNSEIFCENLKRLRENKNYTKYSMSIMVDINYQTYVKIENGIRKPNYPTLINIANTFNVSLQELLFGVVIPIENEKKTKTMNLIDIEMNEEKLIKVYRAIIVIKEMV